MLVAQAFAQTGAPPSGTSNMVSLVMLLVLFVVFYLLLIRPQRKRQKEHEMMVKALKAGDEVITSGGILGRITQVDDNYASLRVANDVEITLQKFSVQAVLPKGTIKAAHGG